MHFNSVKFLDWTRIERKKLKITNAYKIHELMILLARKGSNEMKKKDVYCMLIQLKCFQITPIFNFKHKRSLFTSINCEVAILDYGFIYLLLYALMLSLSLSIPLAFPFTLDRSIDRSPARPLASSQFSVN